MCNCNEPKPPEPKLLEKKEVFGFVILGSFLFILASWTPAIASIVWEAWVKPTYGKEVDMFPMMMSTILSTGFTIAGGVASWTQAYDNHQWNKNNGV